jgi:hypothetical protein
VNKKRASARQVSDWLPVFLFPQQIKNKTKICRENVAYEKLDDCDDRRPEYRPFNFGRENFF